MEQGVESRLPEGATEHVFVVYDGSGQIVHGHTVVNLPEGDAPSGEEMERQALEMAAEATGEKDLAVLEVKQEELVPGSQYRVDTDRRRLQPADGRRGA